MTFKKVMYICKVINNEKTRIMKANFEIYPIGTKVQSYDKDGYYVMSACGIIIEHLGEGDVIIKTFNGDYRSTVDQSKVFEIESLA